MDEVEQDANYLTSIKDNLERRLALKVRFVPLIFTTKMTVHPELVYCRHQHVPENKLQNRMLSAPIDEPMPEVVYVD